MKRKTIVCTTGLILLFAFGFTSCEKSSDSIPELSIAGDDALSSLIFDDSFLEVEDAMESMETIIYDGEKKSVSAETCKIITIEHPDDSTFWPRTIIIDYGEGCIGLNGRVRSGKIIVEVNQAYKNEDYYRKVSFEDYYVDGYKIEGNKTVENEGLNENGNMIFSISLENGKITTPEGQEMTKTFNRMREWINGMDTPRIRWDDEYFVTGSASGINREGIIYTRTITSPLLVSLNCPWVRSGIVEIEAEDRETAVLDYGDGSCDRFAIITVGEESRTIKLHS